MGSLKPTPGRCGRKKKDGTFCEARPIKGKRCCKNHGGLSTGGLVRHGLDSAGFQATFADEGLRTRYATLVDDPNLLDARRAVAVSQISLEQFAQKPADALVAQLARQMWEDAGGKTKRIGQNESGEEIELPQEPPEEFYRAAAQVISSQLAVKGVEAANGHARTVSLAWRQKKVSELLLRGAMPIIREFGVHVAQVIARPKYQIPIAMQKAILEDVAALAEQSRLGLVKMGDELDLEGRT